MTNQAEKPCLRGCTPMIGPLLTGVDHTWECPNNSRFANSERHAPAPKPAEPPKCVCGHRQGRHFRGELTCHDCDADKACCFAFRPDPTPPSPVEPGSEPPIDPGRATGEQIAEAYRYDSGPIGQLSGFYLALKADRDALQARVARKSVADWANAMCRDGHEAIAFVSIIEGDCPLCCALWRINGPDGYEARDCDCYRTHDEYCNLEARRKESEARRG